MSNLVINNSRKCFNGEILSDNCSIDFIPDNIEKELSDFVVLRKIFNCSGFGQALTNLMKYFSVTIEQLEELSLISGRKILRYRKGIYDTNVNREDVLAIVIALQLKSPCSYYLMREAGIYLTNSMPDMIYEWILENKYTCSIDYVNQILKSKKLKTIPHNPYVAKEKKKTNQ